MTSTITPSGQQSLSSKRDGRVKDLLCELLETLNTMPYLENEMSKIIIESVVNQHRSNQQDFWRLIKAAANKYGRDAKADHRNKASRDWCREATKVNTHLPQY